MLLPIIVVSVFAGYAAAAVRRCALPSLLLQLLPCPRCNQDSAKPRLAAAVPLLPTAGCLLAAVDFVNNTAVLCVCVSVCIIISFCIMIRSLLGV